MPLTLAVDTTAEPCTRSGDSPIDLTGTVTVSDLAPGATYSLARYDSGALVRPRRPVSFVANATTHVYVDPTPIASDKAAYYVCVAES